MRCKPLVLALMFGLGSLAAAQPAPPAPPAPPPPGGTTDTGTVEAPPPPAPPPPAPAPAAAPEPAPPPVVHHADRAPASLRPEGLSFGIGVGYSFMAMTNLETPNIATVRMRLPSGLTFEPELVVQNVSNTTNQAMMETTDTVTSVTLGTLVRLPLIKHHRTDFEAIGIAAVSVNKDNPDGDFNAATTTEIGLGWGVGVGYWLSSNWQLSFTATNPLVEYVKQDQQVAQNMSNSTSTTQFGVVFDPTVALMIHLYN